MKRVRDVQWKEDRGGGSIFFFVDAETSKKVSSSLYISYRAQGRESLVSAKTDDLGVAKKELKRLTRNRDNAREGKEPLQLPKTERVTIAELLDANIRRAEAAQLSSVARIRYASDVLKALLGPLRAVAFRPEDVDRYKERRRNGEGTRRKKKVGDVTIRRELEVLSTAFGYAVKRRVLAYAPFIEMPAVDNVSETEFPPERAAELLARLRKNDEPLADLVEFMSLTARRPEGLRRLTWQRFDVKTWTLAIPPEKKGNPVLIGLSGALRAIIERRLQARRLGCDLIFHRDGRPMGEDKDRKIFAAVCAEMELPYGRKSGFTIYTVKSTAVGRMHDAGLSDGDIKDRSGHKTDAMMRRYLKQRPERAHATSQKLEAYLAQQREEENRRLPAAGDRLAENGLAEKETADAERIAVFPR